MGDRPVSRLAAWIATIGGVGYLTRMPGTVGSAVACAIYVFLPVGWVAILTVTAVGTWAADAYARDKGVTDPGEVVVDEVVGMWLTLYSLPPSFTLPAFFLFRLVDIFKPFPVCAMEKLPGGWGIMADDLVGGLIANLILQGLYWMWGG